MFPPTLYMLFDHADNGLGAVKTSPSIHSPANRAHDPERFNSEVGALLVEAVVPHCNDQKQQPEFTLADIGRITSVGGNVPYQEFPLCVEAYIKREEDYLADFQLSTLEILNRQDAIAAARHVHTLFVDNIAQQSVHSAKPSEPETP